MPKVGHDRYLFAAAGKRKARRLRRIVRNRKRQHIDLVDVKIRIRVELAALARGNLSHFIRHRLPRAVTGIDLHTVFPRQHSHAADVVDVLMRDQYGAHHAHIKALTAYRFVQRLSGAPSVDQQQRIVKGHQLAVPG